MVTGTKNRYVPSRFRSVAVNAPNIIQSPGWHKLEHRQPGVVGTFRLYRHNPLTGKESPVWSHSTLQESPLSTVAL